MKVMLGCDIIQILSPDWSYDDQVCVIFGTTVVKFLAPPTGEAKPVTRIQVPPLPRPLNYLQQLVPSSSITDSCLPSSSVPPIL